MEKKISVLKMNEKISVIMGIYNCADTLQEAIECILRQTYSNWELIMCDDGSSDNTYEIASNYQKKYPEKIILIKNIQNLGLNKTLNNCLKRATGEFIARMDGDDICPENRFEIEMKVFEKEPGISIVSSDMEYFDETGTWGRIEHPEYPQNRDFIHGSPFCHAACVVKTEAYKKVKGYSVENRFLRVEDYHLWIKMYAAGFKGKNIHEALYQMRDDRNAYSRRKFKYRLNESYVRALAVKKLKLPVYDYIFAIRPVITGLLPRRLYNKLHKIKLRG